MAESRKATGFYRGDAARLVSEAARLPAAEPEPALQPDTVLPAGAPAVALDDPLRPPLSPAPPTNQNRRVAAPHVEDIKAWEESSRWPVGRIVAWVLLAPWYAAIALGSAGLDVLFVKDLLGL